MKRMYLRLLAIAMLLMPATLQAVAQEPYTVLSSDKTTLTFYYDGNRSSLGGYVIGTFNSPSNREWDNAEGSITTVIFDESFANCTTLTSTRYWFTSLSKLTAIIGIENLKTPNVTDMSDMFFGCSKLESLDVSHFDTGKVTRMTRMFQGCSSLTSLDVSHFDTKNVTTMESLFYQCISLTTLNVSNLNVGKVTNMNGMFAYCAKLESLDLSSFITSSAVDMSAMFWGCSGLKSLDVSSFDTSNATSIRGMFAQCSGLSALDLTNFNTAKVTNMNDVFGSCSGLTSLELGSFDVENVTTMTSMFQNCSNLTSLDLSSFFTKSLIRTDQMFLDCTSLVSIDVRNFDTSNMTSARFMFGRCSSLTTIYCDNTWGVSAGNSPSMFRECTKLPGFNSKYVDATKAKPVANGGYFTPTSAAPPKVCANPTISFVDGKLSFSSETKGVEFVYSLSIPESQNGSNVTKLKLSTMYTISVYARKKGYTNSETVTKDINIRGQKGDVNCDGVVTVTDAVGVINMLQNNE